MLHSVFLLPVHADRSAAGELHPLAALASVLVIVAWNMAEKQEFALLIRSSWGDATVLLATFLLTIFRDLTEGILVGFALGAVLFINRMAQMTGVEADAPLVLDDRADFTNGDRVPYDSRLAADPDVLVYRITGLSSLVRHRRWGRCSTASPTPAGVRGRFRGGAISGFQRGQCDEPGCEQGRASGHPALHHRRLADGAPCAPYAWGRPVARQIPRNHRPGHCRHQGTRERPPAAPMVSPRVECACDQTRRNLVRSVATAIHL